MLKVSSSMEETALAVDALVTVAKSLQLNLFTNNLAQSRLPKTPSDLSASPHQLSDQMSLSAVSTPKSLPSAGGSTVKVSSENAEKTLAGGITKETAGLPSLDAGKEALSESIIRGVEFLVAGVDSGRHRIPWPIGFYFAKLWYHEKLYPHIFTASALGKFLRVSSPTPEDQWPA